MNVRGRVYEILLQIFEICIREANDHKDQELVDLLIECQNCIVELRKEEFDKIKIEETFH